MEDKNSCGGCNSPNETSRTDAEDSERQALSGRMKRVKHKILVLSGKGGVGKSTVAANLASSLATRDHKVGLLDIDIHGPSIPKIMGLEESRIHGTDEMIFPICRSRNLKVMSVGFLLRNNDDPIVWRGPLKYGLIKQFLKDVDWGDLDFLIIDSPPGTGDEPLSVAQLIDDLSGAVIVTTPQEVAIGDVRKSVNFCRKLSMPILGVVENMSGFFCPHCRERVDIFKSGGGELMAGEMGIPFLGRIPFDQRIVEACDSGKPFIEEYGASETALLFESLIEKVRRLEEPKVEGTVVRVNEKGKKMKVAIPLAEGELSPHFGHCQEFALIEVDDGDGRIVQKELEPAPEHQPGLLPAWLQERGVNLVIAGGIGSRARGLFEEKGIEVVVGAPRGKPEDILRDYLQGTLERTENICDH